ncbi:MAG: MaoC/PaaZ C-terminal domain-containing protein [Polyangiales bacterium]
MALDPASVGKTTEPVVHRYSWKDVALYALGVGAKRDRELPFLYEKHGPRVLPTYAVIPPYPCLEKLFHMVGGDYKGVVHAKQTIRLHKPFAPEGTLTSVGKVAGIYDMKRFGQVVFSTETRDESDELVAETEWGVLYRFDGNFGGERPPAEEKIKVPEGEPLFEVRESTTNEQALLYRLSGDLNPLHADPDLAKEVGFELPILHGLCTYGIVGRAVLEHACGGDPTRLKTLTGQFRKPVTPGETLIVTGWRTDGRIVLRAALDSKPDEYVFTNAYAEVI